MRARPGLPPPSFDSIILAAVLAECQVLVGARLTRIHQVDADGFVLVFRDAGRPQALLISLHPQFGRVHLTRKGPTRGLTAADTIPFLQQARSRLEGAMLRSITAPPFERIVTCAFDTLEGPCDLVAEIMGRHSNAMLRTGDLIIGVQKSVRLDRSRTRELLPHRPYIPPAQPRPDPAGITAEGLLASATAGAEHRPAWRVVLDATAGIGAATAHEVCLRAGIDPFRPVTAESAGAVADALHALADTVRLGRFAPVLYHDRQQMPMAYAAFPMRVYGALNAEPASIGAAVEEVTARAAEAARLEAIRQGLRASVAEALRRASRALEAVRGDAGAPGEAERYREAGELLLAYLNAVTPGATTVDVPGFNGRPTTIALDPARTAVQNAQAYFKRYAKAAAARARLPQREASLESERAYLEGMATAIAQADSEDDLWEVEQDLVAVGLRRRVKRPGQLRATTARPRAVAEGRAWDLTGGQRVRVGRSARENDHLTFEVARPDDLWLHARGMPGAHVILSTERGVATDAAVDAAARVAAYYSAGRDAAKVPVDVTRRRHVRRVRGGRPGQVTYTNERTLMVAPGLPGRGR